MVAWRFKGLATALIVIFCVTAQAQQASPYFTGDGGKGIRLAVLEPSSGEGLSEDDQWMLSLIQGSITGDFNKFSGMTIIDRQNLEKVIAEQIEHASGKYSDEDAVRIGNLTNASHILTGSISRTPNRRLMIEFSVTELESSERKASYSPKQVSFQELENLSAIKAVSADLLAQLGVTLTGAGLAELKRVENTAIQGQAMLARAIVAEKRGSEVEALTYFLQAAALDPSLSEAVDRSQILSVNISSGDIGDKTRNDIQRRKDWIARLTEMETSFSKMMDASDPPYKLFYSTGISRGEINYQTETTSFSFPVNLRADRLWFRSIEKAVEIVYNGLNATGKKNEWGLGGWPLRGVSDTNPFDREGYNIAVVFELVNNEGKVIGRQTANLRTSYRFSPKAEFSENTFETVNFSAVNANDISDIVTVRVVSVNGAAPEYARIPITALPNQTYQMYRNFKNLFIIKNGVLSGFNLRAWTKEQMRQYQNNSNIVLHSEIWGDEKVFTAIGDSAFSANDGTYALNYMKKKLTIVGNDVTYIGYRAFFAIPLTSVTLPNSVKYIGDWAFLKFTTVGFAHMAGTVTNITIGSKVVFGAFNIFGYGFEKFYQNNGRRAGTYTYNKQSKTWSYIPGKDDSSVVEDKQESRPDSSVAPNISEKAPKKEPAEPEPERKSMVSIGGGWVSANGFGGGIEWPGEGRITMPYFGNGIYIFLDAKYFEATLSYHGGGATWESANASSQSMLPIMERSGVNLGAFFKYPVGEGTATPFLLAGIDIESSSSAKLRNFNNINENMGALWFKFGGGLDIDLSQNAYLHSELLYGRRTANELEKNSVKREAFYGNIAKTVPGSGLDFKLGIGYKIGTNKQENTTAEPADRGEVKKSATPESYDRRGGVIKSTTPEPDDGGEVIKSTTPEPDDGGGVIKSTIPEPDNRDEEIKNTAPRPGGRRGR